MCEHHHQALGQPARRKFIKLASLGGGVSLLSATALRNVAHAGATEAMLLSCMDYRLVDETERYMAGRGMQNNYDHIVLAGAALGAVTSKFPAWNKTFWEHLDVAIKLHHIHKVIVLDHRDCGAYKVIFGEAHLKTPEAEKRIHAEQLGKLKSQISRKYPQLEVETLLIDLEGNVEEVIVLADCGGPAPAVEHAAKPSSGH